ncbi:TetR family transcriptional regulator [Streptomyces sp. NBC_01716]|uniref:TetR family transcriptional regulator n=1 Tax=Streptomyces sp. NBC_01716 TaxID=2975917 RepID=UPI002E36922D|nr:TetR family transcriptional regulator [Streptomyces sp. NBC_01716]
MVDAEFARHGSRLLRRASDDHHLCARADGQGERRWRRFRHSHQRAEVATAVQDLILERGYKETTVEDICAVTEISRSTFFRYFSSKAR